MKNLAKLPLLLIVIFTVSCKTVKIQNFAFPDPTDTSTRPIVYQEKKVYYVDSVYADNEFDGARLNNFESLNDSTLIATILPENEPINASPHYAFRIWSDTLKKIYLQLNYPTARHRYWPKLSRDGESWKPIDSTKFEILRDSSTAQLVLDISNQKLWVAAQELNTSSKVTDWAKQEALAHSDVQYKVVGKSKLGRDLISLDIYNGSPDKKDLIVILSRQHPPEVTGYLAMQAFVDELLKDNRLSRDFINKYRILVFPLMNPDGVDLGHWRHNAGGIDLNRDWAYYRQPETRTIADLIVNTVNKSKNTLVLGLDFHSTQKDLFYSLSDDNHSVIYPFKDYWIKGIDDALPDYTPADYPEPFNQPVTKAWFFKQFGADSVTYEIGDETPRDFIKLKAEVAAREMMKLLILR